MKRLQLIKDGKVINTIVVDCDDVILNETASPGWSYENGEFIAPETSAE